MRTLERLREEADEIIADVRRLVGNPARRPAPALTRTYNERLREADTGFQLDIGEDMRRLIADQVDRQFGIVRTHEQTSDGSYDRLFGCGRNRLFESAEEVGRPGDYLFGNSSYDRLFEQSDPVAAATPAGSREYDHLF
jgi:hypothetical protein